MPAGGELGTWQKRQRATRSPRGEKDSQEHEPGTRPGTNNQRAPTYFERPGLSLANVSPRLRKMIERRHHAHRAPSTTTQPKPGHSPPPAQDGERRRWLSCSAIPPRLRALGGSGCVGEACPTQWASPRSSRWGRCGCGSWTAGGSFAGFAPLLAGWLGRFLTVSGWWVMTGGLARGLRSHLRA